MRKIIPKKDDEKRKKRNQFIIVSILILIMVFSILGYASNNRDNSKIEKINYNGTRFIKENGLWNADVGTFHFSFMYNPKEADEISSELNYLYSYYNKPLYIYSESSDATNEIYRNLFYQNAIVQRVQNACIEGEKCNGDYPIKTCDDNFIIIKESENNEVIQKKNCAFIKGKSEDLAKLSDGFLFKIAGIT